MNQLAMTFYGFPVKKSDVYCYDKTLGKEVDWVEAWENITGKLHWKECKVGINVPTDTKLEIYFLYHVESLTVVNDYALQQIKIPANNILMKWQKDIKDFCETLSIKQQEMRWYFTGNTL